MLDNLKMLLGLDSEQDTGMDKKLTWILEAARGRLKLLLGGIDPPEEMNHIIIEVSVIRYNRISSEGMEIHNIEGENQHFNDNDFDGFMREIQAFLDIQKEAKRGRVRFI